MSIVNFSVPAKLDAQIKKTIKEKGFASKAEFFRFAALQAMGMMSPGEKLDEVIREARAEYKMSNYPSTRSTKELIQKLNSFTYPAVFEPAAEGGFNVSYPTFPGCVTFGRTMNEAKKMAREVLELWLEELASQKETIIAYKGAPIITEVLVSMPKKAKVRYASAHR